MDGLYDTPIIIMHEMYNTRTPKSSWLAVHDLCICDLSVNREFDTIL
jgi:hypothetical protein